jgi:hypothetical protein
VNLRRKPAIKWQIHPLANTGRHRRDPGPCPNESLSLCLLALITTVSVSPTYDFLELL